MTTYYNTNEFCLGLKILLDKEPYEIIESEFVKPGKGQAFVRTKIRNLISRKLLEKTFKSTDFVEGADILEVYLTYLYNDFAFWYFMNKNTFEQVAVEKNIIGNHIKWLTDQCDYLVTLWNGNPIFITFPKFVELIVINSNLTMKNNFIISEKKLVKLNTGAVIKVPLFIEEGDLIKIDVRSGEYVSRIKRIK